MSFYSSATSPSSSSDEMEIHEGSATSFVSSLTPHEIVKELDRHIIGQTQAKRSVALALRNRWRRLRVDKVLQQEIMPKNILMIGPTGVGKTEIARRASRISARGGEPFIKVEATKFTEVGYVGRDVEQIIRDLVELSIANMRERFQLCFEPKMAEAVEANLLDALVGEQASLETRERFRGRLRSGDLETKEVEIEINQTSPLTQNLDFGGGSGLSGAFIQLSDLLGKGTRTKRIKCQVHEARHLLTKSLSEKELDNSVIISEAIHAVEQGGIVFIDEIDKICGRGIGSSGSDVSREGVQRDLLPLIEGTSVSTKHGMVKTDHILFIASGAFQIAKPSDLLPELQGRLPIRVQFNPLTEDDFVKILTEPEANLLNQEKALFKTEGAQLSFTPEAIRAVARISAEMNQTIENIGARRLHTVLARVLEDLSFSLPSHAQEPLKFIVDEAYVEAQVTSIIQVGDLGRFIL